MISAELQNEIGSLVAVMNAAAEDLARAGKLCTSGVMLAGVQAIRVLATQLELAPAAAAPAPAAAPVAEPSIDFEAAPIEAAPARRGGRGLMP